MAQNRLTHQISNQVSLNMAQKYIRRTQSAILNQKEEKNSITSSTRVLSGVV